MRASKHLSACVKTTIGVVVCEAVFTLMTASAFSLIHGNFFDDIKEWSGPFFYAHQLGLRLKFDVDVKILVSTSDGTTVKTA